MSLRYKAIVSSDWNGCLAPCGPFDCISFNFPETGPQLATIFQRYTGNHITLGNAVEQILKILPDPVTPEQMDAYLDQKFETYSGVPNLIEWCLSNDILFMINTTGMIGYFQRVFAKGLLPRMPVISAHPLISYPASRSDPQLIYDLVETRDKGKNSEAAIRSLSIPPDKIILMGDSGGDGPHFGWGSKAGAFLIGTMTKRSLNDYCIRKNIRINLRFGVDYSKEEKKRAQIGIQANFMDLTTSITEIMEN